MPETMNTEQNWHSLTADACISALDTDAAQGLSEASVQQRLSQYGHNEIAEAKKRSIWMMVLDQFRDFMIAVLIIAAVVSGIVGEPEDAIAIVVIVVLNAIVGTIQEFRAERAVAALRAMAAPMARVLRNGDVLQVSADELVPGDMVQLEAGDVVPADLRLLEVTNLKADESALTGESVSVSKQTEVLAAADTPIGDRINMAHKGTLISSGRASGIVIATGMETELGKIATLLGEAESTRTPLQKRLAWFGRRLAYAVLAICAIIFVAGLLRGEPLVLMFLTAVSLAVAAIPEALPAVVTVSLAIGARKMSRQHALIRRLPAVETLGSVTYICSDKTGTLTQNKMHLESLFVDLQSLDTLPSREDVNIELWELLGRALALSNDAVIDTGGSVNGDPTETALLVAADEAGYHKQSLQQEWPRQGEIPFEAKRQCMSTLHADGEGFITFTKGAPEKMLQLCSDVLTSSGIQPLDSEALLEQAEHMASEGYRVLAMTYRRTGTMPALTPEELEQDHTLLALVGLIDPPRDEALPAIEDCKSAGIIPVMITGDHPGTALAIAQRLGIADDNEPVITGTELSSMSLEEFESRVDHVRVYARVNPAQKIKIVEALQDRGQFVAMTGDGVNDAPALKRADIGVAMGLKGTDVAREAADMVLLDDNFATIVNAVREGRRIFDNIRKFVKYTMTSNAGEIWTLFLAPFLGLPIPLLPIQILWINLVTDGLPGLALANEPREKGIMQRPPRAPDESIFAHGMWQHIVWVGLLIGGLSIFAQAWSYHSGSANWQTMVFTVLTFSQLAHVMVIRSDSESLLSRGLLSNLPLLGAVVLTVLLQLAVIYIPALNPLFHTSPLNAQELAVCFILPVAVLVAVEIEKWLVRRGIIYSNNSS